MGAFAGLLKQAGHRVTGSDTGFYPPMGDALAALGHRDAAPASTPRTSSPRPTWW